MSLFKKALNAGPSKRKMDPEELVKDILKQDEQRIKDLNKSIDKEMRGVDPSWPYGSRLPPAARTQRGPYIRVNPKKDRER